MTIRWMCVLPVLLVVIGCMTQAEHDEQHRSLKWHASEFARNMRIASYSCTLPYQSAIDCSGLLATKPVAVRCDPWGCVWSEETTDE